MWLYYVNVILQLLYDSLPNSNLDLQYIQVRKHIKIMNNEGNYMHISAFSYFNYF